MDEISFQALLQKNRAASNTYQAPPLLQNALKAPLPGFIIISCSDPRINPYKIFGIDGSENGRFTMIRNAGGRALDAVRSISVLQTLGNAKTVVIIHHTGESSLVIMWMKTEELIHRLDCGMSHVCDEIMRQAMLSIAPDQKDVISESKYGEMAGPIETTIQQDVAFLQANPLIKRGTRIVGLAFDILTGGLKVVQNQRTRGV
ncbi:hypothetical protein S40288_09374 [Stachybotrys chartarum IBT 40288]|nr:hypothetical protein S40288_09374 [Stachybotrys chartarum IBT 40288]